MFCQEAHSASGRTSHPHDPGTAQSWLFPASALDQGTASPASDLVKPPLHLEEGEFFI